MKSAHYAVVLVLLAACSLMLQSQELIMHASQVRLRHLAGRVVGTTGASIPHASVELRDAANHRPLASTFTDGNGDFYFGDRKRGERLEMRAVRAGFNIVQYTIIVARLGKMHIRIVLPVAA